MAKKKKNSFSYIKLFFEIVLIIGLIFAYGFFVEPKLITFHEFKITNENITDNFQGLKIVHISDIHYGTIYDEKQMEKLVESINKQKPDIVVLTGDLIDKKTKMTIELADKISNQLKNISSEVGKYAINGNDDLKFDEWSNIITNGGFKNLNNTYDTIYKNGYNSMLISGVSSASDKQDINDKLKTTMDYINSFEKDGPIYNILLIHEPDYIDDIADNKFNLILAGHSHGGQIKIPFNSFTVPKGAKKYYDSYYKVNNSELYVSNGLGVTDYNFRLFNTPSYNIYKFAKK